MTKTRKVVLFIVEGITDKTALGNVLSNLFNSETVRFAMTEGDITTDKAVNSGNVLSNLNTVIKKALEKNAFHTSDLLRVIHLIDTDGAFIPDTSVMENQDAESIEYTNNEILTTNRTSVLARNAKKKNLVSILRGKREIGKKPYHIFYFSRNMEHSLHGERAELSPSRKMELADQFDTKYGDNPQAFLELIRHGGFAAQGDYEQTWNFIYEGIHSLERFSNLHTLFNTQIQ